jgi:hypothetical protein
MPSLTGDLNLSCSRFLDFLRRQRHALGELPEHLTLRWTLVDAMRSAYVS